MCSYKGSIWSSKTSVLLSTLIIFWTWAFGLVAVMACLSLFACCGAHGADVFQKRSRMLIYLARVHVSTVYALPSVMPPSPETMKPPLDKGWQKTAFLQGKSLGGICEHISVCYSMTKAPGNNPVPVQLYQLLSEGSKITFMQLRLAPLPFTHWHSSRFFQWF